MLRHQRSRANCACEPVHETDPDGRRNHPLLRSRESFREQHARCESSFLPIQAGVSLGQAEEEDRSIEMEILYTNCAGLDVHKKTVDETASEKERGQEGSSVSASSEEASPLPKRRFRGQRPSSCSAVFQESVNVLPLAF